LYPMANPNPTIMELLTTKDVRFLSMDPNKQESFCADEPAFFPFTLEAGTYDGQDYDVNEFAYSVFLVVSNDLEEDLVYEMAKSIYENPEELVTLHPTMKESNLDYISRNDLAPWHPGVVKYFKEKGVWTTDMEEIQNKLLAEVQ